MSKPLSVPHAEVRTHIPLVDLHDHLDGGLRPQTVIDLARECGYSGLPTYDAADLAQWFVSAANSGSLERFLETFAHTVAVLQTAEALSRVAAEAVVDLARDGVAWAEIRMAPELCENEQMSMDAALTAMLRGLREGEQQARNEGMSIQSGLIVCAMRQTERAQDVANLVRTRADDAIVGFDIAGPEAGWPPSRLASAFATVRDAGVAITVHAGEADGVTSIKEALDVGAQRLGHGVRVIEDIEFDADGQALLGPVAREVRDRGIALEVCPTSNVQTGAVASLAAHPLAVLDDLGFVVTVNPDNRLMCGVGVRAELALAHEMRLGAPSYGNRIDTKASQVAALANTLGAADNAGFDLVKWTRNAVGASFAPAATKQELLSQLETWESEH